MKTLAGLFGTMALTFVLMELNAQTNSTVPAVSTAPASNVDSNSTAAAAATTNALHETEIFSDHFDLDSKARTAVYTGNVRVVDPRMKMTCDVLTGQMGESTNRFRHVVAEGNVVIDAVDNDGKPVHATSGRADYDYRVENSVTNEIVKLSIDPRVEQANIQTGKTNIQTGKTIVWDRTRDMFSVEKSVQHLDMQGQGILGGSTNRLITSPVLTRTNR